MSITQDSPTAAGSGKQEEKVIIEFKPLAFGVPHQAGG